MSFSYTTDSGLWAGQEGQQDLELDVAIVGAGVSGLYSGWRLRTGHFKSGPYLSRPPETHVFELSSRVGGRLLTVRLDGMPHVRCELGGMRYIHAEPTESNPLPGHQMVHRLGKHLGLTPIEFPMGDGNGMYYLRRQRVWLNDIKAGIKLPYNLAPGERGRTDEDLFNQMVRDVLDKARKKYPENREEWNKVKQSLTFKGSPTSTLGFWNLLSNYFNSECYLFLQDANGYDSNTMNWNAGEAIQAQIGDFGTDTQYYTFQEGYDGLAHSMAESFCQAGGKIWVKNGLVTFDKEQRNGETWLKLVLFNEDKECRWHVYARKLILAMPRRSLELLDQINFFFDDRSRPDKIRPYIQSVIIQPSFKLYLGYRRPWWRPNFDTGRTISDLPTRQVYYFGTEEEQPSGEGGNTNSLLMASYTDEWAADFWRPLEEGDQTAAGLWQPPADVAHTYSVHSNVAAGFSGPRLATGFQPKHAPKLMVEYAQRQLREIHGNSIKIPEPYVSAFYDWGDDPYGGGYHAWAGGRDVKPPWEAAKRMRQPLPNIPVHVCGEAYSDQQAWVEGALCTAELMLQDHFGMDYPTHWLCPNYYFGW